MGFRYLFILIALALVGGAQEDQSQKDLKAMAGSWSMVGLEVEGEQVPLNKVEGAKLTIKGDLYSVVTGDVKTDCRLHLDAGQTPKRIDMTFVDGANKDMTSDGIYELTENTLKICRNLNPGQPRPQQFGTWPKTNHFVVTWQRK